MSCDPPRSFAWATRFLVLALLIGFAAHAYAQTQPPLPPPEPAEHAAALGAGINRTMHLLSTSTPEHRNRVRILFYGQSITEQEWWHQVADDLRSRFPHADLVIENRAIGGFPSQRLVKTAEHDVFAFYPDLVIFHVYGANQPYEAIIRSIRSRTTAEVLIQSDHAAVIPPATISRWKDKGAWWDDWMNHTFLPRMAARYGCGLVDIRTDWVRYLKTNHLPPSALLLDDIHLNPAGCNLMARLVERYLVVQPGVSPAAAEAPVRTEPIGRGLVFDGGRLTTRFAGNRVDLVAGPTSRPTQILDVRVDGKKPSEIPELYAITRPEPKPWSPIAVIRVDHDVPVIEEDWTLTVDQYTDKPPTWTFHVVGSKTGPDGSGTSAAQFVSKSKRVRIEADSWFPTKPVEPGYAIRWSVRPQFVDVYTPPPPGDPALERTTTLFQGLPNGTHTLELVAGADGPPTIAAIRSYDPPFKPMDPIVVGGLYTLAVVAVLLGIWWAIRRWTFGRAASAWVARRLPVPTRRRREPGMASR